MFKKILVPVDLEATPLAERALAIAVEQARLSGGELIAMTVVPGFGMPLVASFFPEQRLHEAATAVRHQLQSLLGQSVPADLRTRALVAEGSPAERIAEQAQQLAVELIVMPSASRKLERRLLGSCAARVVELAPCPVLVVKA